MHIVYHHNYDKPSWNQNSFLSVLTLLSFTERNEISFLLSFCFVKLVRSIDRIIFFVYRTFVFALAICFRSAIFGVLFNLNRCCSSFSMKFPIQLKLIISDLRVFLSLRDLHLQTGGYKVYNLLDYAWFYYLKRINLHLPINKIGEKCKFLF